MARKNVAAKITAAQAEAVNAYMVDLWGDDPGTQEFVLNAYVDGADEDIATHAFSVSNNSQADANSLCGFLQALTGCDGQQYPISPSQNWWAVAFSLWGLKPVVVMP